VQILLIHFCYVVFFLYLQTVMCHRVSIEYCNTYFLKKKTRFVWFRRGARMLVNIWLP